MIIKTKNKTYKGSWYIKGTVENETQKLFVIPSNETEEREVVAGEWVNVKMQDGENLNEILIPQIGGTYKVIGWTIKSGYVTGTILDIELTIKTIQKGQSYLDLSLGKMIYCKQANVYDEEGNLTSAGTWIDGTGAFV